jgi:putative membrane protein
MARMGEWPALLTTWDFRLDVSVYLALSAAVFTASWLRLRRRGGHRLAAGWRLVSFLAGLGILGLAMMSAIDLWAERLFFMHMIQHLLLIMVVPPLLLLANPFPFMLWGLPGGRELGRRLFTPSARFRRALRGLTRPGMVWVTFVAVLWSWHDPYLYGLAQGPGWIHDLEHLLFFGTGMLFWWHAIGAGPRLHGRLSPLARIGYLLAAGVANLLPGVIIALADTPLYPYYAAVSRPAGITLLQEQSLSGIIMWVPGTMMYWMAALVIVIRRLNHLETQELKRTMSAKLISKLVVGLTLGLVLAACGGGGPPPLTVAVTGQDIKFEPTSFTAQVGQAVTVNFENAGALEHSFLIDELNVKIEGVLAGESGSATFTPSNAGTFTYYCNVTGHREAGMVGTLTVSP